MPERDAVREASLDERIAAEDHGCGVNCGACVSQCGDAPRGLSFEDAVVRRGLINALRFASTEQAVRELDEFARTLGVAECGERESPLAFHIRIADALLRPALPADVQAAERGIVFLASTLEGHHVSGDGNFLIAREMCAPIAAYLRTLLAHLTREAR